MLLVFTADKLKLLNEIVHVEKLSRGYGPNARTRTD
jgi:hypothetical protein